MFQSQVRLYLKESKRFCSLAYANDYVPIATLSGVKQNEAHSTSFPIVPTELGEIPIEVLAIASDRRGLVSQDGIRKTLLVLVNTITLFIVLFFWFYCNVPKDKIA